MAFTAALRLAWPSSWSLSPSKASCNLLICFTITSRSCISMLVAESRMISERVKLCSDSALVCMVSWALVSMSMIIMFWRRTSAMHSSCTAELFSVASTVALPWAANVARSWRKFVSSCAELSVWLLHTVPLTSVILRSMVLSISTRRRCVNSLPESTFFIMVSWLPDTFCSTEWDSLVCFSKSCWVASSFCSIMLEEVFTESRRACLVVSLAPVMLHTKVSTPTLCASSLCTTLSCEESNLCSNT
mmetsp:Transcript_75775/g.181170  ORF Transcript_75775/g.181170 Transcript_75775/m.181170 type:complete len:246 (-) Transcript_75775:1655-2392(-)